MSELMFKACGIAAIASMLILLVKKWGSDLAVLLKIASSITLAALCFGALSRLFMGFLAFAVLSIVSGALYFADVRGADKMIKEL